jgi:lisH domain-containing protein FOPNL
MKFLAKFKMATLEELKNALRETLESRGIMNEMKAKMRSEIFQALDDTEVAKPKLGKENMIINELIREYL